jgi:hypothetical protein
MAGQLPLEVQTETAVCTRCQTLSGDGELTVLINRALRNWCRSLGGVPDEPGWWDEAWRTFSARLAAWMTRRHGYYMLEEPRL